METSVMHPTYLPFSEAQVLARLATVTGGGDPAARLDHYRQQLAAFEEAEALRRVPRQRGPRPELPIERDERFWTTTALLGLLEGPDPVADLVALLTRAYGPVPPFAGFASWSDALGTAPELYLEAHLPSPASYQQHLRVELRRHVLSWAQYQRGRETTRLEGTTTADAVVVSPSTGVAVVVAAKVLSDVAAHGAFDVVRNQLARVVDVTLDRHPNLAEPALRDRRPDRTCVLLLTPEVFRDDPTSRLYGHLHTAYTTRPETLAKHLPHRPGPVVRAAASRLGWATWEDVERVRPGCLPWRAVPGAR
ncbi:hypothetical protein WDZ17_00280 [Pseudokineococcus basanitobsidens]|uniref:Uncharacterized protein n=1 Tax=Pseudokineococcus basanitobsidens TaxID=1926649 RepID=A0ABU8RFB8_9ACTN